MQRYPFTDSNEGAHNDERWIQEQMSGRKFTIVPKSSAVGSELYEGDDIESFATDWHFHERLAVGRAYERRAALSAQKRLCHCQAWTIGHSTSSTCT